LQEKDFQKEAEAKKEPNEDDSVVSAVERHWDSESHGKCGKACQDILNSIAGLFSEFSGATGISLSLA